MIGTMVHRYRVLERLGGGGMGVVYRAEDTSLGRPVALKFLAPAVAADAEARRRFMAEARAACAVEHEGVCAIHEIGETSDGELFIAMDYCEGESLRESLRRGPLPPREAAWVCCRAARALEAAHGRGVVHRDVKPANVMVGPDGRVRVVDFGLARIAEASALTRSGMTAGTLSYMSPEQAKGLKVDGRTDVWSLGALLFECLAGKPPFIGKNEQSVLFAILRSDPPSLAGLRAGVPAALEAIVRRALEKDPSRRYASMGEMAAALESALRDIEAGIARPARRPLLRLSRRAARISAAAIALTALAVLAAVGTAAIAGRRGLPTVAVAAFRAQAEDADFASFFRDELSAELTKAGGLRVISAGSDEDLKARFRLEGSLIRGAGRLRVTARLVASATGENLWADTYDRPSAEVLAVRSGIASEVARAVKAKLDARPATPAADTRPEAEGRVRELLALSEGSSLRGTVEGDAKALSYALEASALAPADAQAASRVACARWTASASWKAALPPGAAAAAEAEARAASVADPRPPLADLVLAAAARDLRGDLATAGRMLGDAAAAGGGSPVAAQRALLAASAGDLEGGLVFAEEAVRAAPAGVQEGEVLVSLRIASGDSEGAARELASLRDFAPGLPVGDFLEGELLASREDWREAAAAYARCAEAAGRPALVLGRVAWALGKAGDRAASARAAAALPPEAERAYPRALAALGSGDAAKALELLEAAAARGEAQAGEARYAIVWKEQRASGGVARALAIGYAKYSGEASQ